MGDPAETYRQEAQDLLEQLEQSLLDLERSPEDPELVNAAFRALHTIKGSGAMFGFDNVASFTHHVETAFDQVRQGRLTVGPDLIALTLEARDHIRALIFSPEEANAATGTALLGRLAALVGDSAAAPVKKEEGKKEEKKEGKKEEKKKRILADFLSSPKRCAGHGDQSAPIT